MLGQRIVTALLMLAVLLPSVLYPTLTPLGVVTLLCIAAAVWEWARLNQCQEGTARLLGVVVAAAAAAFWALGGLDGRWGLAWQCVSACWVLGGAWLLYHGVERWKAVPKGLRLLVGVLALLLAWVALMQARRIGINFLFSAMALVWVADIGAYFSGRAWGGRLVAFKLAPHISPGKTWEGFLGGAVAVLLCAVLWLFCETRWAVDSPSLFALLHRGGVFLMVLGVLLMVAMSVVGDLVESLFKRSAGVKDSSGLLPGHGGVLDRLDALLPTLPMAMGFAMLTGVNG